MNKIKGVAIAIGIIVVSILIYYGYTYSKDNSQTNKLNTTQKKMDS